MVLFSDKSDVRITSNATFYYAVLPCVNILLMYRYIQGVEKDCTGNITPVFTVPAILPLYLLYQEYNLCIYCTGKYREYYPSIYCTGNITPVFTVLGILALASSRASLSGTCTFVSLMQCSDFFILGNLLIKTSSTPENVKVHLIDFEYSCYNNRYSTREIIMELRIW